MKKWDKCKRIALLVLAIIVFLLVWQKCEGFYEGTERFDGIGNYG